jgi:hypothetical protein
MITVILQRRTFTRSSLMTGTDHPEISPGEFTVMKISAEISSN